VVSGTIRLLNTNLLNNASGVKTDVGRDAVATMQGATVSAKGNQLRVLSAFFTGDINLIDAATSAANTKQLYGSSAIALASTIGSEITNIIVQNAQCVGISALTLQVNLTQIASRAGGLGASGLLLSGFRSAVSNSVIRITGAKGTEDISLARSAAAGAFVSAVNAVTEDTGVYASGTALYSVDFGSDQTISLEVVSGTIRLLNTNLLNSTTGVKTDVGRDAVATMQGATVSAKGNQLRVLSAFFTGDINLIDAATSAANTNKRFKIRKSGLNFQLNSSDAAADRERIGIRSIDPSLLGASTRTYKGQAGNNVTIYGYLTSVLSGGTNDLDSNPTNALKIVDRVIDQVTDTRSYLGAFQRFTIDSNRASLDVAAENLAASESTIRDLDFVAETAEFTRTQILFQAGTAVLGQANQIAQTVLTLPLFLERMTCPGHKRLTW
jgi:flagellin